jgi:hypothetical protein
MKEGAQPVPFESADAECTRLREENARLRESSGGTQYPHPTERGREPACRQICITSGGQERTSQKESRTVSEPFSRKRGRLRATMGEPGWPVGIYVEKRDLLSAMLNRLLRLAAFQNPEFYTAQMMGLSTYDKPRVIACGQDFAQHVALPRGCLPEIVALLEAHRIRPEVRDERFAGTPIDVEFRGELRPPTGRRFQNHPA